MTHIYCKHSGKGYNYEHLTSLIIINERLPIISIHPDLSITLLTNIQTHRINMVKNPPTQVHKWNTCFFLSPSNLNQTKNLMFKTYSIRLYFLFKFSNLRIHILWTTWLLLIPKEFTNTEAGNATDMIKSNNCLLHWGNETEEIRKPPTKNTNLLWPSTACHYK